MYQKAVKDNPANNKTKIISIAFSSYIQEESAIEAVPLFCSGQLRQILWLYTRPMVRV